MVIAEINLSEMTYHTGDAWQWEMLWDVPHTDFPITVHNVIVSHDDGDVEMGPCTLFREPILW